MAVQNRSKRVAVIGAGLAGLTAGVALTEAGAAVTVFDPAPAGGKARTVEAGPGWRVEWGPHFVTHRGHAVFALAQRMGLGDQLQKLGAEAGARYLLRGGRLKKLGLFGGGLRLRELWEVARGFFRRIPLDPEMTMEDWGRRQFGPAFAAGPLSAMTTGIWASPPSHVAFFHALPTMAAAISRAGTPWAGFRSLPPPARPAGTYAFRDGMGTLTTALAARCGALLPATIRALRARGNGYTVASAEGELDVDAVVLATDATDAAALLGPLAPVATDALAAIRYAPLAVVHWMAPDVTFPRGFGWLAPPDERAGVLGTIQVSDLVASRCPPGSRSFATMVGGNWAPDDVNLGDDALRERVVSRMGTIQGRPVTPTALTVVRHPRAVALPGPGHGARVKQVLNNLPVGVALAGAWTGSGAMPDAVQSGQAAAERILGQWGQG